MTVESVTYITDLDNTYPASGDVPSEGDDHIRNIKTGLAGTFPNFVGSAVTVTEAEINILDGVTATAAELNILDGVTATAAELNILDGVTATAAELNLLDGKTSVATTQANTFHGDQTISSSLLTISPPTAVNSGIEVGYVGGANTVALIDFHSGAVPVDYDVRIHSTGGSGVTGGAWCYIEALGIVVSGVRVATITASTLTAGTLLDARVAQSNVTQHQAALSVTATQLTGGTLANARVAQSNVTQHQAALSVTATQLTGGTLANARVAQSNVTQHETALTITQSQISDLDPIQTAVKTSDEAVVSSGTLQDDDDLTLPMLANSIYEFKLFLLAFNASATPDIQFSISLPSGATSNGLAYSGDDSGIGDDIRHFKDSTVMIYQLPANLQVTLSISGTVVTSGTAGNFLLQWSQYTANASTTYLRASSCLKLRKLA